MNTFKGRGEILVGQEIMDLQVNEYFPRKTKETLPSIYRDRFRPKNQWIVMQRTLYKPTRITYKALKG